MLRDNSRGAPGERSRTSGKKCTDEWLDLLVADIRGGDHDLETLTKVSLESLAEELEFRRAYLLFHRRRISGSGDNGGELDFDVFASRLRLESEEEVSWVDVTNPDFAVNRSVSRLVLESRELIVFEEEAGSEESGNLGMRPTLCRSFALGEKKIGILYLEREFGTGVIEAASRVAFDRFVDVFAPVYSEAFGCTATASAEKEAPAAPRDAEPEVDEAPGQNATAGDAREPVEAGSLPEESYFGIIGRDEKIRKIFEIIEKVRDSDLNVCIYGESGTGKELIARALHQAGRRREQAFVPENCGAIAETLLESELFGHVKGSFTGADEDRQGLFSIADKGTLFLDEIGDMSENMQRKLLRTLQEGLVRPIGAKESLEVDTRVVCASNTDLKKLVERGEFRADLFYRLNVIGIEVPPLRQRRGDIPLLVEYFLGRLRRDEGISRKLSSSALRGLVEYGWPGNVRELWNVLHKVLLISEDKEVARKDLAPFLNGSSPAAACLGEGIEKDADHLLLRIPLCESFNEIIDECERLVLLNALNEGSWNKSRVTRALNIPRQSLYNKIAKYGLKRPTPKDAD